MKEDTNVNLQATSWHKYRANLKSINISIYLMSTSSPLSQRQPFIEVILSVKAKLNGYFLLYLMIKSKHLVIVTEIFLCLPQTAP